MGKYSTPGVYPNEIDVSEVTEPVGIGSAGIALRASRGRANIPFRIISDKNLIANLGSPVFTGKSVVPEYGYGLYASLEFLKESDNLTVVRVVSDGDKYAGAKFEYDEADDEFKSSSLSVGGGTDVIPTAQQSIPDKIDSIKALDESTNIPTKGFLVSALGPGDYGKHIAIGVEFLSENADWLYNYDEEADIQALDFATITTEDIANLIAPKVVKLTVYVKSIKQEWQSEVTKDTYEAVETFYVSFESIQDENQNSLEIRDVINGRSKYIYITKGSELTDADLISVITGEEYSEEPFFFATLNGGDNAVLNDISGADVNAGWNYFANKRLVDVDTLIVSSYDMGLKQYINSSVLGKRLDCFMVAQSGQLVDNTVELIKASETYGYTHPSYVGLYCGYGKIKDMYNDKFVWIPNACFAGSVIARNDNVAEPWFAPAGTERGVVPSIEQNVVFEDTDLGRLYDVNINPVAIVAGTGAVIYGQKTAQRRNTARNRINVRRTLLYISKTVNRFLETIVFNFNNTETTRLRVSNNIDNFLDQILAAEGINAKDVVCDDTNNSADDIDNNMLNVDVYITPTQAIEFIPVNYVVTRTGVNFSEVRIR